jgi:hypothetical protein
MKAKMKIVHITLFIASVLGLASCGGGSGGSGSSPGDGASGNQTVMSSSISGTAAVGAPLVGTVTVKDALGATKTSTIGTNGSYSVDVTGMTAPFVFRASGIVNGQTYTVHSIATSADIDGKINITQLTDLVVANIAGQIAQNYFDDFALNGNASTADKAAIDAEVAKLKEKLLPVLLALGVEAGVDLLRTPFTPLASALDQALDAIQVSVDSSTNVATISNLLNDITVADDLAVKAAAEAVPATLSADNVTSDAVATAAGDAVLVKKVLTDFTAKFATGLPSAAQLTPLITTGFRHRDSDGTAFANEASTFSDFVGGSVSGIEIHQIDYSDTTKITARVSFTFKDINGFELDRERNWRVRKGTDGVWRLHGDQRVLDIEPHVNMVNGISTSGSCVSTGLEFDIENNNTGNDGGTIAYILVTGPGLPSGGLRYVPPPTGGLWNIDGQPSGYYIMANSCNGGAQPVSDSAIAAIPDEAFYRATAYTGGGAKINFPSGTSDGTYGVKTKRRPLTLAEANAATFPTITSPDSITAFSSYTSGAITIAANNINASKYAWVYLAQNTDTGDFREISADVMPAVDGTLSTSLALTSAATGNINWRTIRVASKDAYRRSMMTLYEIDTRP